MRHFSLFSGSGIGDYAAEQCGIKTIAQCENDSACLYCLKRIFPDAKRFTDIRDITDDDVRSLGRIDIISGGFPCTDISTAGKGAGLYGKRSSLWFEMLRIIIAARPTWVFAENVSALRVRGADRMLSDLEGQGYTCWPCMVGADAAGGNIPRKRVWVVAYSLSEGRWTRSGRKEELPPTNADLRTTRTPGPSEVSNIPVYPDGLPGGLSPKVRNTLLRMVGNSWNYPVALMFYQWIAKQKMK